MEEKEVIIRKEADMMAATREVIAKIVAIRLEAQKIASWLKKQDAELGVAAENMADAIDALYDAEKAMGDAHQNLLVSQATLKYGE